MIKFDTAPGHEVRTIEDIRPPNEDDRVRHYVERLTPKGFVPPKFSDVALCGAKVKDVFVEHNGEICQKCVDESRKRPVEE